MSRATWDRGAIEQATDGFETVQSFQRALDLSYQRVIGVARREWERRFAAKEASDACVHVRIRGVAPKPRGVRGSAFLHGPRSSSAKEPGPLPFPRLAH